MDFDKLYDMFCEYYHDDGSNEEIMRGRIEKAFLKYAQTLVKKCSIADVSKSLPSDIEVGKAMSELSKIADKEAER